MKKKTSTAVCEEMMTHVVIDWNKSEIFHGFATALVTWFCAVLNSVRRAMQRYFQNSKTSSSRLSASECSVAGEHLVPKSVSKNFGNVRLSGYFVGSYI